MTAPRKPEPLPPFIDWMSRHGIKVIGALVLLEFLLHGWTLYSSKQNAEAEPEPAVPVAAPPVSGVVAPQTVQTRRVYPQNT